MSNDLLASKVVARRDTAIIRSAPALPTAVLGLVGTTVRGPIGIAKFFTSFSQWLDVYGEASVSTIETWASVQGFFEEGGQFLWFVRTAHYTDITNALTLTTLPASIGINTSAATAGRLDAVNALPLAFAPNDSLSLAIDGAGAATGTVVAAASTSTSVNAEPYALTHNNTLIVEVDGGAAQTVTFDTADFSAIAAATADEVATVLNLNLTGCFADGSSGSVVIESDRKGTGSLVDVSGGTDAAPFAFPVASAGTGNVSDSAAVSFAEMKALMETAIAGLAVTEAGSPGSGLLVFSSVTTGVTSTVEVTASTNIQTITALPSGPDAGTSGTPVLTVDINGKWDGTYANLLTARVLPATSGDAAEFDLHIIRSGLIAESFPNLSMDPASPAYIVTALAARGSGSRLVDAVDQNAPANGRPADGDYVLSGGSDGSAVDDSDFIGSSVSDTGMRALDVTTQVTLLSIPARATAAVHNAMVNYATNVVPGIFVLIEPPAGLTAQEVITYLGPTAGLTGTTDRAAVYWPRVQILNPNKAVFGPAASITVPNTGLIAGVFARTDSAQPGGIYTAPANVANGRLATITGLEDDPNGADQHEVLRESTRDLVFPKLINPISDQGGAFNLDGARTLDATSQFPGVAEQRGVMFIETALKAVLQFARHLDHTEELREEAHRVVSAFLRNQMSVGAFRTRDPSTAFLVDVSKELNTDDVVFAEKMLVNVSLATKKTVTWVVLTLSQDTRSSQII